MAIQQSQYEDFLATYTDHHGMLLLLKKFRPYLEMLPSMRRPQESLITIPLPVIKIRETTPAGTHNITLSPGDAVRLPCDVAVLMCDPDWKIKTGVEIFVFIHRPNEDFSDLLSRWRQTQLWINKGYDWLMPTRYRHIFSEGAEESYALFVIFPDTPERIRRGLNGAALPYVIENVSSSEQEDEGREIAEVESSDVRVSAEHLDDSAHNASVSDTERDAERLGAEPMNTEPMDAEPFDAEPFDAEPFDPERFDKNPSDAQVPDTQTSNTQANYPPSMSSDPFPPDRI